MPLFKCRLRTKVILLAAICTGCQAPPPPPSITAPAAVLPQPAVSSGYAETGRVNGEIGGAATLPRASAAYSAPPPLTLGTAPTVSAQGDISLNFAGTDIRTVVGQILGDMLHLNYTIDPSVQGTATFQTATPISRDALIPTLQTLLAQNQAVLVRTNGLYRVMPADKAAASPVLAGNASLGGAGVIPLHYAQAADLAQVLQPYVANGGAIIADPVQNALLVEGDPATRAALTGLIEAFDVDELAGQSYELFPVVAGDAKDFASAFTSALGASADPSKAGPITVVPLERINAVLVIAKTESYLFDAQRVYAVINQVQRETVRSWHVYYIQNGRANDAAYVLQQAFTPDNVTAQPTPVATGQAVSGLADQNSSSSGSSVGGITGLGGSSGVDGVLGSGATNAPATASAAIPSGGADTAGGSAASALLGPLSATSGAATTDAIRIIPDNQNNSLLIYATADEDDQIEAMLGKIDLSPVEVRIDATIAEVDLDNALQYGTQFFFKSGDINAVLSTGTSSALNAAFPGFVLSGAGSDAAPLAISALQSVTKVNILSSPELMVLDGQAASLQVGNLVPYLSQTSQDTTTANSPVINSIDYRETGVILQVTPHVGSNGLVTLDVAQEVSGVQQGVTTAGINSPTFSERAVTSRVAIQDGETIGLAGLISDDDSHGNSGLPFLKNVPLLGDLVSTQTNSRTRTELLVLITPHVIRTQTDADALTADLKEALPNAATVPGLLQTTPVGGGADPDERLRARLPPADGD
jgi:general secretion pathway protein D